MHRKNGAAARIRGFTLIELSVVVLVITLLLGSLLVPLATQVEQRNVSETQKRLQEVKEALIGYAIANGRFPCPAEVSPVPDPNDRGNESFDVGGTAANGKCKHPYDGYVPGITLGLSNLDSQGFVVDAWGLQQNRLRYAITPTKLAGTDPVFTSLNGMRTAGISSIGGATTLLYICATSPANLGAPTPFADCAGIGNTLSSDAIFVIYSLGKNAATPGTSTDEAANLKPNFTANPNYIFVSKVKTGGTGPEFDDIVLWTSRYNVLAQLTAAGQLP